MSTTRGKILEAALRVFSLQGYHKATTRAIAKEAEVNEVTLFRLFGTKQRLFDEVIGTYSALPYIDEARETRDRPFEERLKQLTDAVVRILEQRKDFFTLLLAEGTRETAEAEAIMDSGPAEVIRRLTHWFAEEQKAGSIRSVPPDCAARALMGMFLTFILFQRILPEKDRPPQSVKRIQKAFLDIFLHGVLPKENPS